MSQYITDQNKAIIETIDQKDILTPEDIKNAKGHSATRVNSLVRAIRQTFKERGINRVSDIQESYANYLKRAAKDPVNADELAVDVVYPKIQLKHQLLTNLYEDPFDDDEWDDFMDKLGEVPIDSGVDTLSSKVRTIEPEIKFEHTGKGRSTGKITGISLTYRQSPYHMIPRYGQTVEAVRSRPLFDSVEDALGIHLQNIAMLWSTRQRLVAEGKVDNDEYWESAYAVPSVAVEPSLDLSDLNDENLEL